MEIEADVIINKLKSIIADQAGQIAVLQAMIEELQKPTDT